MAGLLAAVLSCAWLVQAEARITKTMDQWVCDYCSMGKYQHAYWAILVIPETVKDIFWPIGIGQKQKPFPLTFWRIADDAALFRSPGGPQRVRHPHPLRVLRAAGLHRGADRLHHALQGGPQIEQSDKLANCQLWATGERSKMWNMNHKADHKRGRCVPRFVQLCPNVQPPENQVIKSFHTKPGVMLWDGGCPPHYKEILPSPRSSCSVT